MFSRLSIYRPIIASVLALGIVLGAGVALFTLPVIQSPQTGPPTVVVSASYPGVNAQTVTDTVAAPLKREIQGVEGMASLTSKCADDGNCELIITFRRGTDLDMAQVLVQNRVALALPTIPAEVQYEGVSVKKRSAKALMLVKLYSSDGKHDVVFLSHYATIFVRDELSRVPGVGDVICIGRRDNHLQMWLDPKKLLSNGISALDVVNAINAQNVQVAAPIDPPPMEHGKPPQLVITSLGRLESPEQFGDIILHNAGDKLVRLKDVARIEPREQPNDPDCTVDGKPAVGLEIYQIPGDNPREVSERVKKSMEQLKARFPPGLDYVVAQDVPPFSWASVWTTGLKAAIVPVAVALLVVILRWGFTQPQGPRRTALPSRPDGSGEPSYGEPTFEQNNETGK